MSLPPDQSPPSSPSAKLKPSAKDRQADRLATIRLRMAIYLCLEDRNIITPAAIGEALGISLAEVTKLMTGRRWQEGDVALLQAAAARLGVQVPSP